MMIDLVNRIVAVESVVVAAVVAAAGHVAGHDASYFGQDGQSAADGQTFAATAALLDWVSCSEGVGQGD